MEENAIKNSIIGTYYEKNNFYMVLYDINKKIIRKELISDLQFSKDKENNINFLSKNININNKAFCFDCEKNIDFNENLECKTHNIRYLNDLIKDINIKDIEENLKLAVENYEKVYKIIEGKLNEFKKRNENQIKLAQKIIEIYKSNLDNLNYQIVSNIKDLSYFNQIKLKDFEGYNLQFVLETNILKEYSINNYINEKLKIKDIQKNLEIKNDNKLKIRNVVILNKQGKIIFNSGQTIFLLNNKSYSLEDKIEINEDILALNIIKEEDETVLISSKNSIKKVKIVNNRLKIENFLNNIFVNNPGIVIKYQDEYAWTNGKYIEFSLSKRYNLKKSFEKNYFDYETSYSFKVINLIQFFDDLLFVISLKSWHEFYTHYYIMLGSYKNVLALNNYIELEKFDFDDCDDKDDLDYYRNMDDNYNIHVCNYEEIIIGGKLGIYIINPSKWEIKKIIILNDSDKLIENVFYLNDSSFLIFIDHYIFRHIFFISQSKKSEKLISYDNDSNILIAKIGGNYNHIIFETFLECEEKKIYYNSNINSGRTENNNLINKFISFQNDISVYEFIDIEKKLELKNLNI